MGMPIILSLYWIACKVLIPIFMETNYMPNTDVSMVDCILEYQLISDIHVDHETGPRSFSPFVASMITVYKHM